MGTIYDVAVIGAGIAGASVARELSRTHRVILVEAESQPGYHSTGRSAAAFIPSYGAHCNSLRSLTLASEAFFSSSAQGAASVPLLKPRGLITISDRWNEIDSAADCAAVNAVLPGRVSLIHEAELRRKLPQLRSEWSQVAWFEPDVFDMDVDAIHQIFLAQFRQEGGELVCGSSVSDLHYKDRRWILTLGDLSVSAATVVNASGAWAEELAKKAGGTGLGLTPMRRTALSFSPPPGVEVERLPLVLDQGGSFYMKPDAGQILVSLADETPSPACDAQPEEIDVAYAVHNMQQAFDIEVKRVSHRWAGLRTFAPDREPVFGFDPILPAFFWAAGHGGHGIQIAPAAARVCAALLRQEDIPKDITELGFQPGDVQPARLMELRQPTQHTAL